MANRFYEDKKNHYLNWHNDSDRDDVDGDARLARIGRQVQNNIEATPVTVATNIVLESVPTGTDGATETAALYIKHEHGDTGSTEFVNGIYGEVSENQSWVGGAFTKVIHRGAGDCHYVALLGDDSYSGGQQSGNGGGFGYEAAMFRDQQTGFLASFQGLGAAGEPFPESIQKQDDCVAFHALVHDDSTDPTTAADGQEAFTATNTALFYANNSLSNAFVARVSEYATVGLPQFKLMDTDQNILWAVYGDGQQHIYGSAASSGSQNEDSTSLILRGFYWDGDSSEPHQTLLTHHVSGAPTPVGDFRIYIGEPSSETLIGQFSTAADGSNAGLNMQNNVLYAVGTTTMTGANINLTGNTAASAGTQNVASPFLYLQGRYWTGSASAVHNSFLVHSVNSAPTPEGGIDVYSGLPLSEELLLTISTVADGANPGLNLRQGVIWDTGNISMVAPDASSGVTNQPSPILNLRGKYWDGAASQIQQSLLRTTVNPTGPECALRFDLGAPGGEDLICYMGTDADGSSNPGINLQDNGIYQVGTLQLGASGVLDLNSRSITNGATITSANIVNTGNVIQISTQKTPSSAADTGTAGQIGFDANYIYVCTGTDTWKRVAVATW